VRTAATRSQSPSCLLEASLCVSRPKQAAAALEQAACWIIVWMLVFEARSWQETRRSTSTPPWSWGGDRRAPRTRGWWELRTQPKQYRKLLAGMLFMLVFLSPSPRLPLLGSSLSLCPFNKTVLRTMLLCCCCSHRSETQYLGHHVLVQQCSLALLSFCMILHVYVYILDRASCVLVQVRILTHALASCPLLRLASKQIDSGMQDAGAAPSRISVFYDAFYDKLFELAPETKALFDGNMVRQSRALVKVLTVSPPLGLSVENIPYFRNRASRFQAWYLKLLLSLILRRWCCCCAVHVLGGRCFCDLIVWRESRAVIQPTSGRTRPWWGNAVVTARYNVGTVREETAAQRGDMLASCAQERGECTPITHHHQCREMKETLGKGRDKKKKRCNNIEKKNQT